MTKDRRLGRGLAQLLGTPINEELASGELDAASASTSAPQGGAAQPLSPGKDYPAANRPAAGNSATVASASTPDASNVELPGDRELRLPVAEIDPNPFQPRRVFKEPEIESLAESLKSHQMLQPILVRKVGNRYQLISGERRWRAAQAAGWTEIPARVRDADDRLVAELAIVENLQRQDLNPIEKALAFRRYLDQHVCTQEDLATRLKIDRSTVTNLLRLLELPSVVQDALAGGDITAGHARALLPLGDPKSQEKLCVDLVRESWSVRETESRVQEKILAEDGGLGVVDEKGKRKAAKSQQVAMLEQDFKAALGAKVEIRPGTRGRGKIVIHYRSHEEFERLQSWLMGEGGEEMDEFEDRRAG